MQIHTWHSSLLGKEGFLKAKQDGMDHEFLKTRFEYVLKLTKCETKSHAMNTHMLFTQSPLANIISPCTLLFTHPVYLSMYKNCILLGHLRVMLHILWPLYLKIVHQSLI